MSRAGKMTYAPLYFEEFKGGCEDLTNEQIGVYLRILFEIYEEMGPINFDNRRLAKRLNCRPHKAQVLVSDLIEMRKLYLTSAGQISNHRAESEIAKFVSISVQNRLNGKSPKTQIRLSGENINKINAALQRPLSENEAILEDKNKNKITLEGSALPQPRGGAERAKSPSVENFIKRREMFRRASG